MTARDIITAAGGLMASGDVAVLAGADPDQSDYCGDRVASACAD